MRCIITHQNQLKLNELNYDSLKKLHCETIKISIKPFAAKCGIAT